MPADPAHTEVRSAGLAISESLFAELLAELANRGAGYRESGAFLLADRRSIATSTGPAVIVAVAYYDDLDPNCLTGGITFGSVGYTALNARCRQNQLCVVGDIHTHPRSRVAQSATDADHPMAALDGHIALIAPAFARGPIDPEDLGAHLFHAGCWTSYFGGDVATVFTVIRPPSMPPRGWRARFQRLKAIAQNPETRENAVSIPNPDQISRTVLLGLHDSTQPTIEAANAAHSETGIIVVADDLTCSSSNGQAALLTAVATAVRAFGNVLVVADSPDVVLRIGLHRGSRLSQAIVDQDASLVADDGVPSANAAWPMLLIGGTTQAPAGSGATAAVLRVTWVRWTAIVAPVDIRDPSDTLDEDCVLAAIAAAALGVSEAFSFINARAGTDAGYRTVALNLWNPADDSTKAPS